MTGDEGVRGEPGVGGKEQTVNVTKTHCMKVLNSQRVNNNVTVRGMLNSITNLHKLSMLQLYFTY